MIRVRPPSSQPLYVCCCCLQRVSAFRLRHTIKGQLGYYCDLCARKPVTLTRKDHARLP